MDTPIEEGTYNQPIPPPLAVVLASDEDHQEDATEFDVGKAARYSVANLGAAVVYGLFNTALPLYLDKYYRLPAFLISLLANERSFVGAFVQPFVGRLSDRTRTSLGRRRPFFLVGVPLMAASLMALALHPDFWIMLGIMTVGSFFLAVAMDPYIALMADLFPMQHRGKVGGFIGLTNALGVIIFALAAKFLWENDELAVFALTIGILVVTFAFTFFTVKEPALMPHVEPKKAGKADFRLYLNGLRQYSEARKYVLALTLFWTGTGGAAPFVTLFGTKALGAKDGQEFLLPLAFVVTSAFFSVPAGLLADRVGKKPVMTVGLIIYGLGALVGSQSTDLTQATIALGVIGIGNAGTAPLNPLLTDLIPRKRVAELIGLGSAMWSFVQPLGSVLAGIIVEASGLFVAKNDTYRWAFVFAGVMIVLAAIMLQRVHPERAVLD